VEVATMRRKILFIACVAFSLAGCAGSVDDSEQSASSDETLTVLGPDEKADNFRSQSAQEYFVRGTSTVELGESYADASEEERMERVRELVPYKQVVIGYFLNTLLVDKSDDADNSDYGGFKALTKNGSYEDLGIEQQGELTYSFEFVQEVGGQLDLLEELNRRADAEPVGGGAYEFELAVGKIPNDEMTNLDTGHEWYRRSPWSDFSPEQVDASRYYMQTVEIEPQERSEDAWIDYNRLFEDGTVNIGMFFGWDYHDAYHQTHAERTYRWLLRNGYESPVDNWEEYATNRAPLTKTIEADGESVDVEVTLWWGEPDTVTDPGTRDGARKLVDAMENSFKTNEVTAFSGHSGPFYGFALANWRETGSIGEIDDTDIPDLEMPSDKYQIVLAEGCDTYALGEAFWKNPNKADEETLDVITTTSFSNAATNTTNTDFLKALTATDGGTHQPTRYSAMLEDMDSNGFFTSMKTMYGVHGIDDNPTSHPYANPENACSSCSTAADCGGQGNHCVDMQGANVCTYECTADSGCPDGYTCRETRAGERLSTSVCVPRNYSCQDVPSGDEGPSIRINELLADPPSGEAGDVNGDGERDARADEYVEVTNVSDESVDISGWELADEIAGRYQFPADTVLEPGDHAAVFGGGEVEAFTGLPESAEVLAAESGLYLNNRGDTVTLVDHNGEKVDAVDYGTEGGEDVALVRTDDGELSAADDVGTPGSDNE
jgi:hypothetical protein